MIATLLALALAAMPAEPPACAEPAERWAAIAAFLDVRAGQTVGELAPDFELTDCLADLARPDGAFLVLVDGSDRIEPVMRRVTVNKRMKRDAARYAAVPLVEIEPKKVPASREASVDRIVLVGAREALADRKRTAGMFAALGRLAAPAARFAIVGTDGDDAAALQALSDLATGAGWQQVEQAEAGSGAGRVTLLKFARP